jgi:hypothetical protein
MEYWENDNSVEILYLLDDINQPYSCQHWGDRGVMDQPMIINDGSANIIHDWFDNDNGYPDNIFIDHDMKLYHHEEGYLTPDGINTIIQDMVDNIPVNYLDDIQPIFNTSCVSCHDASHSTGLNLMSYSNVMEGSNNGDVITPLDHSASLLWQSINSGEMPPNSDLMSTQIDLIATWIDQGALECPDSGPDDCGVCGGDNSSCTGCMDEVSCNYSPTATISGDCEYPLENHDCSGNCNVEIDCFGTCGGSLLDDNCGACGGDNSSCTGCMDEASCNYSPTATISGDCEYPLENHDCSGNCNVEVDCAGTCGGSSVDDVCGVCAGIMIDPEECPECLEGEILDCYGLCVINGSEALDDECGVCNGDNSSCTGCMDDTACNYSSTATISGDCEYPLENYDCSGNCNVEVDCAGTCGGSLVDDNCGACGGDNSSCTDCNGVVNGSAIYDPITEDCVDTILDISVDEVITNDFAINSIYPNPFNPVVNIEYSLSTSEMVKISIFGLNGQIVDHLFSGNQSVGNYQITWDASEMSSGIYLITIQSGNILLSDQLILLK